MGTLSWQQGHASADKTQAVCCHGGRRERRQVASLTTRMKQGREKHALVSKQLRATSSNSLCLDLPAGCQLPAQRMRLSHSSHEASGMLSAMPAQHARISATFVCAQCKMQYAPAVTQLSDGRKTYTLCRPVDPDGTSRRPAPTASSKTGARRWPTWHAQRNRHHGQPPLHRRRPQRAHRLHVLEVAGAECRRIHGGHWSEGGVKLL